VARDTKLTEAILVLKNSVGEASCRADEAADVAFKLVRKFDYDDEVRDPSVAAAARCCGRQLRQLSKELAEMAAKL